MHPEYSKTRGDLRKCFPGMPLGFTEIDQNFFSTACSGQDTPDKYKLQPFFGSYLVLRATVIKSAICSFLVGKIFSQRLREKSGVGLV